MKTVFFSIIFLVCSAFLSPEEGMFPLGEIQKIDLSKSGLNLSAKDIYNPNGVSLIDALVRVGGCTGSFISKEGLIITNHHCAFGAVQQASSVESDFITKGFYTKNKSEEIEAKGIVVRITQSYSDVSEKVLSAVKGISDPFKYDSILSATNAAIVAEESLKYPDLLCEVSEMFAGKSYILFRYQLIKDVRLVYVPPKSIGDFGGESDNWIWPRHSGDFAILRAYVGKDGKTATYSSENIPFIPKKFLKINAKGASEDDFVFVLGYPGKTFRNQPSAYLNYQVKYQLPFISRVFQQLIDLLNEAGKEDKSLEIRYSARIKSLANTAKNYRGKLSGLSKIQLLSKKKSEDMALQAFLIKKDSLYKLYGKVIPRLDSVYAEAGKIAEYQLWSTLFLQNSAYAGIASVLYDNAKKIRNAGGIDSVGIKDKSRLSVNSAIRSLDIKTEARIISLLLWEGYKIQPQPCSSFYSQNYKENIDSVRFYTRTLEIIQKSKLYDSIYVNILIQSPEKLEKANNKIYSLVSEILKQNENLVTLLKSRQGTITYLTGQYSEMKRLFKSGDFIPDANGTLRFTYGKVKGYEVRDGEYLKPVTTYKGILEKAAPSGDYVAWPDALKLFERKDFGSWSIQKSGDLPIDILYDTDTTGGNSGSPVMDANGSLVAINFDRAYGATINDYAWNKDYSRSIGVDIRYVLWNIERNSPSVQLLKELEFYDF
jgi:hypothetical protein